MDELFLTKPTIAYLPQIKAYRAEFSDCLDWMHGSGGLMKIEEPEEWLRYVALCENEETVPEGASTSSQFIFVRKADRKIVGMINIRHRHTEPLSTWGGHIGYSVSPSERRKGYATQMLHDALPYCKSLGLNRVLLTAGDENIGSVKAIVANGGILESYVMSPKHHVMVGRYWIEIKEELSC